MPGSGKSTLGRAISSKLDMPFFDLDDQIIQKAGMSINDIFALHGEDYFRQIERDCLRSITTSKPAFVLATGGGAACFYNNMDFMNENGCTVFLDITPESLAGRLKSEIAHRPLLKEKHVEELNADLAKRLLSRRPYYELCKIQLRHDHITLDMIMKALKDCQ